MEYRTAHIYFDDTFLGELSECEEGYVFIYDKVYFEDDSKHAISLTLPKTQQKYCSKTLFPFFDGLIPEGWMLNFVSTKWGINIRDRFGILLVACKDTVSRVRILEKKI